MKQYPGRVTMHGIDEFRLHLGSDPNVAVVEMTIRRYGHRDRKALQPAVGPHRRDQGRKGDSLPRVLEPADLGRGFRMSSRILVTGGR